MEFLIPGLILVALMVWASTRIKRNAAAAFDAESIETDNFEITKPEGFLHVLNDDSGKLFRAYSRNFGTVHGRDFRQVTVDIDAHEGKTTEERRAEIVASADSVSSESTFSEGDRTVAMIETAFAQSAVKYASFHKLIEDGTSLFELRIQALEDHRDDNMDGINELLGSFHLK